MPIPVKLPAGAKVTAVAAGHLNSLARTGNGKALAWGDNTDGQLGNGATGGNSGTPARVKLPAGLVAIAIGSGTDVAYSMAIVRRANQ